MSTANMQRKLAKMIARAWAEPDYLVQLKTDPARTLRKAGLTPPEGATLHILENSAKDFYLVIPQKPEGIPAEEGEVLEAGGLYTLAIYTMPDRG